MLSFFAITSLVFINLFSLSPSYNIGPIHNSPISSQKFEKYSLLRAERWEDFEGFQGIKVLGPSIFHHLGDELPNRLTFDSNNDSQKLATYNLNVGKALETLRRELPFVFALSNLDFSIFAAYITVADGSGNKMSMPKNLYVTAVKSVQMAASFSSSYPSMNVKKIDYIEECGIIQCLVDVTLPDTVRVDGQAVWEGMFYFGLDKTGHIDTHVFDRKISSLGPKPQLATKTIFSWVRQRPLWSSDQLASQFSTDSTTEMPSTTSE